MNTIPESSPAEDFRPLSVSYKDPDSAERIADHLSSCIRKLSPLRPLVFVCVGTDRSTGDALGPITGSNLKKYGESGFHLFGTLDEPVHAMNLHEALQAIRSRFINPFIIGIDACLGQLSSVGNIKLAPGPLRPGAGVNKHLPEVGEIHITGVVNVGGFMEYFVLQNTRLSLVMNMAGVISEGIRLSLLQTSRLTLSSAAQTFSPQPDR